MKDDIITARYSTPDQNAMIVTTSNRGDVLIDKTARPEVWDAILKSVTPEPFQPVVVDHTKLDQDTLNDALSAEGSVIRALALVVLDQINELRIKTGDKAYTMPQFMAALRAKMR